MSDARLSVPARIAAGLVAFAALVSIGIEFAIKLEDSGVASALWSMARYFTYLTNATVVLVLGAAVMRGRWTGTSLPAALSVWIVATGIVYHVLLAKADGQQGIQALSDFGLHTAVPIGCFAVWAVYCPKHGLTYLSPLMWAVWPLVYAVYALLRGLTDGKYPYFFLDPAGSGLTVVIAYIVGLGLFFILSGSLLVMSTHLLEKHTVPKA